MAFDTPTWIQADTYDALSDRQALAALFGAEGIFGDVAALKVSQRASGTNMSVDVAAGSCAVTGDDVPFQGTYLTRSRAVQNIAIGSAPSAGNRRIDRVGVQVRDASAAGGSNNDAILSVVAGTVAATVSAVAPAEPASFLTLALVTVDAGTAAITDAMVTDQRAQARRGDTTAWTDLPYATLWTHFSNVTGSSPPGDPNPKYERGQYRRSGDTVQLRGVVTGGDATHQVIATLPAGFRPSRRVLRWCGGWLGSDITPVRVDVDTDGTVQVVMTSPVTWLYVAVDMQFSTL